MSTIAVLTSTENGANSMADINNNFANLNADKYQNSNFIETETPTGVINGSNVTYTLANTPITGSVKVWVDGMRFNSSDYSVSGTTLTLGVAPRSELVVDYRKA